MAEVTSKTKKYEKLVGRCEMAVKWMDRQAKKMIQRDANNGVVSDRELTEDESQDLRNRLVTEMNINPYTSDREHIDYDPLRYWILYIKHIREHCPNDVQQQFLLNERCARTFMARPFLCPKYVNDPRFIRICILYADKTSNPGEVFKLMSKSKVGTKIAIFWVAWAWVTETAQDFAFTEKIFQKAISVGAEPRKTLEDRQRQFLRRMSRHWLNASKVEESGLEEEEEEEGAGRGALSSLSGVGVARNDRGSALNRHVAAQEQQQQRQQIGRTSSSREQGSKSNNGSSSSSAGGFSIFQEGGNENNNSPDILDDENNPAGGRQRLAKESDRTKENNMRPEQWNERGYGLVNPGTTSSGLPHSDSIVGIARDSAPALFGGRPPVAGGLPRSNSGAAFEVFVDEEFVHDENEKKEDTINSGIEQRSLRQRLDGGAADRLTRDPIRYMKNPSKIQSDQRKYDAKPEDPPAEREEERQGSKKKPEPKEKRVASGGFDKHLLKDKSGYECCFEEQRMISRYYNLTTPQGNFNELKQEVFHQNNSSQMDVSESMNVDESTIDEIDMEDDTAEEDVAPLKPAAKSVLKSSLRHRPPTTAICKAAKEEENTATVNPRRVLFGANTNVVYTNESVNTSTCSSQLNGSFAPVEETINTKLANAEISMMFSSPNANASLSETPAGKSLLGSSFNQPALGSSFAIHDENKAESGGGLNFSIYQEDGNEKSESDNDLATFNGTSFEVHDENKSQAGGGLNFSIYQEDDSEKADPKTSSAGGFAIHDDNEQKSGGLGFAIFDDAKPSQFAVAEDSVTASLSVIGDVMSGLGSKEKTASMGFGIYSDPEPSSDVPRPTAMGRGCNTLSKKKTESTSEATASLSDIGAIMGSLEDCSVSESPKNSRSGFAIYSDENNDTKPPRREPSGFKIHSDDDAPKNSPECQKPEPLGFGIYSDEVTQSAQKKQKVEPCFGDISRIEDEKTSNFQIMDETEASMHDAIDYTSQHEDARKSTMRKCMSAARQSRSDYRIFDYRNKPMPKALLRKSFANRTEIDLSGGETFTIVNELGRGVYGVVLLCNDDEGHSDAIKIQAPIGTLAHEYSLLLRIEKRVSPDPSGFYPFPRSRALYAFSEGGLFSMTAASDSGMTLIDVVNTYKKIMGNVPELVAIYYTSRMLRHLESLHQDGKVLVSPLDSLDSACNILTPI